MDSLDTWLQEDDVQRLWQVCHGLLPETAATFDEIKEFERIVMHTAMIKMGGAGYTQSTLQ
jgi:hypothetical protein